MINAPSFAPQIANSLTIVRQIEDFDFDHGTSIATQLGEDRKSQEAYEALNGAVISMESRYHGFTLLYLWLYSHQMDALNITQDCPDRVVWILWDLDPWWIKTHMRKFAWFARRALDLPDSYAPLMEKIIDRLRTWAITTEKELPDWIGFIPADSPLAKMLQECIDKK